VSDTGNSRILEFDSPLTSDAIADHVIGQPDFTSRTPNNGGVSASSLSDPWGLAVDHVGNLYVADPGNNRVLRFNTPLASNPSSDRVFGQPGFDTTARNNGGLSAGLDGPYYVAVDAMSNLYVADLFNHRVLVYDTPHARIFLPMIAR
jgi:hypothetical protein